MSSYHNDATGRQWLEVDLSSPFLVGSPILITGWALRDPLGSAGNRIIAELKPDTEGAYVRLEATSLDDAKGGLTYEGQGAASRAISSSDLSSWEQIGVFAEGQVSSPDYGPYHNDSSNIGALAGGPGTGVENLNNFAIGSGNTFSTFTMFNGYIADIALWKVANEAAADAIMTALYNSGSHKSADNIAATATPDYYWPLTDATQLAASAGGQDLVNGGAVNVAWSSEHPTLITAGGGGGSSQLIISNFM